MREMRGEYAENAKEVRRNVQDYIRKYVKMRETRKKYAKTAQNT